MEDDEIREWVVNFEDDSLSDLKLGLLMADIRSQESYNSSVSPMKELVLDRIRAVKIEIFADEHPPPHFRVKYNETTANFNICDCMKTKGEIKPSHQKIIEKWWRKGGKQKLIDTWNRTRPSDCPVGKYR